MPLLKLGAHLLSAAVEGSHAYSLCSAFIKSLLNNRLLLCNLEFYAD